MAKLMEKTCNFLKKETVFAVSLILALVSGFFVKPHVGYVNYVNWDTIVLLLVIMVIVEILKNLAVFEVMVRKLLVKTGNTRGLVLTLVSICFISSIFITNDVSLIIFVPFAILALKKVRRPDLAIVTVCLQTIAANVGCMLLPTGAPHNIVMYTVSKIPFDSFMLILLPYIIVSLVFMLAVIIIIPNDEITLPNLGKVEFNSKHFLKRVLLGVDYYLLLTFIALFILIGNLENITFFSQLFRQLIIGNEVIFGIIVSQIISNVPAAMLLTGFSSNYKAIIIGINLGGFGTLIASMANLISFKLLIREYNEFKTMYLIRFTVLNVVLLGLLLGVYAVIY